MNIHTQAPFGFVRDLLGVLFVTFSFGNLYFCGDQRSVEIVPVLCQDLSNEKTGPWLGLYRGSKTTQLCWGLFHKP